jgi:Domain of unknown function (DUF4160)
MPGLRTLPTVLRIGPYRIYFYAGDRGEPPHVHVDRDENMAKIWLDPVRLQMSRGFRSQELNKIAKIVEDRREQLRRAWSDYFKG